MLGRIGCMVDGQVGCGSGVNRGRFKESRPPPNFEVGRRGKDGGREKNV
jgi:hypothetical protein